MAIKPSGYLTFTDIVNEFGGSQPYYMSNYYRGGPYVTNNNINIPTSGQIWFSQFYGASATSGVNTRVFDVPGSYTFVIPSHSSITLDIAGAGGGGGGAIYLAGQPYIKGGTGTAGNTTSFSGPTIGGGMFFIYGYGGQGGTGGGSGDIGQVGQAGGTAGGQIVSVLDNGGQEGRVTNTMGGRGGGGGRAQGTWAAGTFPVGVTVNIVVGAGGTGGAGDIGGSHGHPGGSGRVIITWM